MLATYDPTGMLKRSTRDVFNFFLLKTYSTTHMYSDSVSQQYEMQQHIVSGLVYNSPVRKHTYVILLQQQGQFAT